MEEALRVMRILIDHQCEPGIEIANAMAQNWFIEAGLEYDKYSIGLARAADNGWLLPGSKPGTILVTDAGVAAATRTAH
jgi:hypothetical protein